MFNQPERITFFLAFKFVIKSSRPWLDFGSKALGFDDTDDNCGFHSLTILFGYFVVLSLMSRGTQSLKTSEEISKSFKVPGEQPCPEDSAVSH